jgi:hypothetical protein
MLVFWDEEVLCEADAAAKFYQQRQVGLGKRFLDNLAKVVSGIARHHCLYRQRESNIRNVSCYIFLMVLFTEYRLIRFKSLQSCIYGKSRVIGSIGFDL